MDPSTTHNTLNKLISENLDDAQKQVEVAKDFLEYGRLLFVKKKSKEETNLSMNFENRSMNESSKNLDYIETKPNSNVEFDSTHQIVDEVFEEYIKEEYLKPLQEEGTGPFDVCKLDKFLVKNFMVELKETLIDVKKSMTERETMALKRLREGAAQLESSNSQHKSVELTENDFDKKSIELKKLGHENVLKDTIESNFSNFNTSIESKNLINEKHDALNSSRHENIKENIENNSSNSVNYNSLNIPVAPAMPSLNISPGSTDFSVNQKINVTLCCSEKTSKMNCKDAKHERKDSEYFICRDQENEKKKREIRSANKRNAELNSQKDSNGFLTQSPPIFLSEDIIEGSGENSEMEEI
ncbi:hypothetical protein KM043_017680 [Ampulex compressa]|nr:hypothetical protein KM043_017680 [Ampulex compressa]